VAVHVRRLPPDEPFSALARLFLLGLPLAREELEAALDGIELGALERDGWLELVAGRVRARLKLVPHGDLLIASDRDGEGPTSADWVAGMHPPSVTLAKLTVRLPLGRALDVATGNGIQALLAARHAESVVATDVNPRALTLAALNARLNDVRNIEFREGSYFEPVAGERFDLLTCNPPYVISPESQYAYRDSGLPGDSVSREVVRAAPQHLREGGFAHLLISWAHPRGEWFAPLERWVEGCGCDCWLLYFGSDDPVSHAAEWLRPLKPEPEAFQAALARWLDYLQGLGIEAIAHGAVILRRRTGRNWLRAERVELDRLEQAGEHLLRVFGSQDYLESLADEHRLLDERFVVVERHHLEQRLRGSELQSTMLVLDEGLGFRVALDLHSARLLPLLDGTRTLRAALVELQLDELDAALPVVRRLLELGFLERALET
jgi:methylase of polypeptide subunit release factors